MTAIADLPDIRPSLLLDFANSGRVDPRIQCTRASSATCFGPDGKLRTVPANTPRIDYDPVTGKCLGLLVEEARTNLVRNSRKPVASSSAVGGSGVAVGAVTAIAPDGLPIEAMVETESSGEHYVHDYTLAALASGASVTQSIFVKKISDSSVRDVVLRIAASGLSGQVRFQIRGDTCTLSGIPTGWKVGFKQLQNGWWYVWGSYTASSDLTNLVIRVQMHSGVESIYTGNPAEGLFLFGRQVELGAFPTSYIPTEASAVTRAADTAQLQASQTAGQWLNASQGTLLAKSRAFQSKHKQTTIASLTDGSQRNRVILRGDTQVSSGVGGFVVANSVDLLSPAYTPLRPTAGVSVAVSYATNSAASSAYGDILNTSFSGQHPQGIDRLVLGNGPNTGGAEHFNGHISLVAYYPVRITNEHLKRLTA